MIGANCLPNIHDSQFRLLKVFPINMELLLLLEHYRNIDEFMVGLLNDALNEKTRNMTELDVQDL